MSIAKIMINGLPNTGKCQDVNTLIPTPGGWRRLGDIKVGDLVFTETGEETVVTGVYPQGIKANYKVSFLDGTSTNSCNEHLWKVKQLSRTIKDWRILSLKEIMEKDVITKAGCYRFHIPITEAVQYSAKALPVDPYILGVLIGDGSLTCANIVLTSHIEDSFVQEFVQEQTDSSVWTSTRLKKKGKNTLLSVLSRTNPIAGYIKEVGLNVLSKDRFIPSIYLRGSIEQRKSLLAGLLDTDGSQSSKHNCTSFSTKSIQMAKDIIELVQSLGGLGNLKVQNRGEKGIEYNVTIRTLFNPFILPRKALKWRPRLQNGLRKTISKIERLEDCEQVCIKVDNENETYLTNDYIVTHNTSLLKTLKDVLVYSRDGKPFSLPLPHVNIPDYDSISELLDLAADKMAEYEVKYKSLPKTVVFDSVSTIFMDIVLSCTAKFKGFDLWEQVDRETRLFLKALEEIQSMGINIVLISHVVFDGDSKKYIETCAGKFAKKGGFLSCVDYALNIDMVGNKRIVTHRNTNMSRTFIDDMPDKQSADDFNLQEYIDKIKTRGDSISAEFSL